MKCDLTPTELKMGELADSEGTRKLGEGQTWRREEANAGKQRGEGNRIEQLHSVPRLFGHDLNAFVLITISKPYTVSGGYPQNAGYKRWLLTDGQPTGN